MRKWPRWWSAFAVVARGGSGATAQLSPVLHPDMDGPRDQCSTRFCGPFGFSERARVLTLAMTMNRLIQPCSEHAMPDWIRRSALADILDVDFAHLRDKALKAISTACIRSGRRSRRPWP